MNQIMKKSLSVLMALLMVFSLFAGLQIPADAATVDYQYGSTAKYSDIIKNWGTRGELATFLSPNAEEFYADTSYDELATMAGSSDITLVDTSALYSALNLLMKNAHKKTNSYEDTKTLMAFTDIQSNGIPSNKISALYSGGEVGPEWDSGDTWNREHTWPNSKGGSSSSDGGGVNEVDIMMIRPETASNNSSRGNKAYGVSAGFFYPNLDGSAYDVRGDVARTVLYVYVRWGTEEQEVLNNMWGSDGVMESKEVLLDWIEADPVDTWEMGRNDSVQSITGTRNVFVDYPELAFDLFEEDVPSGYETPSGSASATNYTITAQSNNTAYGTVSVSGSSVTAYPASGYQVAGYQVTSGNATVKQYGNVFSVNASSDCTILISFEPAATYTVRIVENGATKSTHQIQVNQSYTLPAYSGTLPEGYSFVGWAGNSVDNATVKPAVYAAGSSVTVTSAMTFYAVASYFDGESGGTELTWTLVTDASQIGEGSQVVIAAAEYDKAMGGLSSSGNNHSAVDVTKSSNTLTISDAVQVFTLEKGSINGSYAFNNGGKYLCAVNNSSNYLKTSTSLTDGASFYINAESDGTCAITSAAYDSTTSGVGNVPMQYNTQGMFSCYPKATQKALSLYVGQSSNGTTYYTTSWGTTGCSHENETPVVTDPTCTEQGYTDYYCADCGEWLYREDYVAALGHSYQSVVTDPTFSAQGYTTHTCSVCGDSYVDSYTSVTDVAGWSLILGSDLSVNFKLAVHESIADTAVLHIAVAGADKAYAISELTANADGFYYVSVKMAAAQMTDDITVQIVNGTDQSEKKTYSVRAYADSILAGEYSEETKTLVTQMLHYGAAAQNYFNYRTDSLADSDLTATLTAPTTVAGPSYTGTVAGITYSGATLVHRERIAVRFYFEVTGDISAYSFTVNGNDYTPAQKGGRYYIEVADINPQDLDNTVTVKVNNALTVVYSPMNYIVNMYKKGSESLQALVKTLYNYHLAAEAYLAA